MNDDRQHPKDRVTSLFSWKPRERNVLLGMAALRAGGGAVVGAVVALVLIEPPWWVALPAVVLAGIAWAIVSADWIEHYARLLILGYSYNANVSARGEWEGWTGPTNADDEAEWRRRLFTPLWPDDPGAPYHYPYPIPTFWGRVRAIWKGEE